MNRTNRTAPPPPGRQYWVWVTGPEYYLDSDGADRFDLDPDHGGDDEGWWTCHKNTQAGDLVLLYRTSPRSDIAYLLEAKSPARILPPQAGSISERELEELTVTAAEADSALRRRFESMRKRVQAGKATQEDWNKTRHRVLAFHQLPLDTPIRSGFEESYVCDWKSRYKFVNAVRYSELAKEPYLSKEWGPIRARFRRRVYSISPSIWMSLMEFASATNRGMRTVLAELQKSRVSPDIISEKQLENLLESRLDVLKPEYDLEIYRDEEGRSGRQYPCAEAGGWMDLLCRDRATGGLLVIELKVTRAGRNTVGQISTYIGWVREHLAKGLPVRGLVISSGVDTMFHFAAKTVPDLGHLELGVVRSRLA